jgi:hypothetical protein
LAFLRFSRDKRGVENFYLVQPTTNRRGKVRPRVLYWFRSPPDVKIGRAPFDAEMRRALELQNPDVDFDWRAIVDTPIPSADADKWRERRRAERAAKHAAAEDEPAEVETAVPPADAVDAAPASSIAASGVGSDDRGQTTSPAEADARRSRSDAEPRKRRRRRRSSGGRPDTAPASSTPPAAEPSGD